MAAAGVLIHSRHLQTVEWERLVWGVPGEDSLGSLPKVVELLLAENSSEPITTIVLGCGPSKKDGLSESVYTKQYFLAHLPALKQFPRFRTLSTQALAKLHKRLQQIITMDTLNRSIDEVIVAADIFKQYGVHTVLQVTAASHAPRCVQIQAAARAKGHIPTNQQWLLVADERCYEGADPFATLIMEPPHRGDDPMLGFYPSLPEVLKAYQYELTPQNKKMLIRYIKQFIKAHSLASDVRELVPTSQDKRQL